MNFKSLLSFIAFFLLVFQVYSQRNYPTTPPEVSPMPMEPEMTEIWNPEVPVVAPGNTLAAPPSDALVLFNGQNLDSWESQRSPGDPVAWKIVDGQYMEVVPGSGNIQTKMKFGDCQLHIEWSAPDVVEFSGQGRGNSGIFFQNRYEVQVLDSYKNRTYRNGQAASIYKDKAPLVNAMRPPNEWNTYDIIYTAPRFKEDGSIDIEAKITVLHNGVVVQNNATVLGLTLYIGVHHYPEKHGEDVLALQDHGTKVQYRNIWIRRL